MSADLPKSERPLSEQFRIVAKQYAAANKEASFKERTRSGHRSRLIARMIAESNEKLSVAMATMRVEATDDWLDYNREMVEERERADVLKAQMEYIRICQWEQNDANANARQERKLD